MGDEDFVKHPIPGLLSRKGDAPAGLLSVKECGAWVFYEVFNTAM